MKSRLNKKALVLSARETEPHATLNTRVSISEYRKILKDTNSSDEKILNRLGYIEALCRNVIQEEIRNYADT